MNCWVVVGVSIPVLPARARRPGDQPRPHEVIEG